MADDTEADDPIGDRARVLIEDTVKQIEREAKTPQDIPVVGLGILISRAAKLEAVLEKMSEIIRQQSFAMFQLTLQIRQNSEHIGALLNDELRAKRSTTEH